MKITTTLRNMRLLVLLIVFITVENQLLFAQCSFTQIGIDIKGEVDEEQIGRQVSLSSDGLTLAVGSPRNLGGGIQRGQVKVYKNINGAWTQYGAEINGDVDYDYSGYSVSLSSDGLTIAIGSPINDGGGVERGHVRVFKNISGNWIQQGANINGVANNDLSGTSVSLSADGLTVAIGSSRNKNRGNVRVYNNVNGDWTQLGAEIVGEATDDMAGIVSLSADGFIVAIGATRNAGNGGIRRGHVRVFKIISGNWTQLGNDIDGVADYDQSGIVSLSADGLTVAIGATENDGNGSNSGHTRVYKYINETWIQQGADIQGVAIEDYFGRSVSLSADGLTVAISATSNSGGGIKRGHVRVFNNISGTWIQQGFNINGEADNDNSGVSVSLSADGLTIAISAPWNAGGGTNRGHVRVFKLSSKPKIKVKGNNLNIVNGDNTPDYTDSTDFGSTDSSIIRSYKIYNLCTDTLKISGIISSGSNAADFIISGVPSSIIGGDSAMFTVTFFSTTAGVKNAIVNIISNDIENDTFIFAIRAERTTNSSFQKVNYFNNILIYPNPINETLNLDLNLQNGEAAIISITDMLGKTMLNQTIHSNQELDLKSLVAGVYILTVQIGTDLKSYKVIKQ